jgi:ribonuclease P protein component
LPEEISSVLRLKPSKSNHFSFHEKSIDPQAVEDNVTDAIQIEPHKRLGLAIPKKLAKRAIDRNRIKRLIRENFRIARLTESFDIVVKLKAPIGVGTKRKLRNKERLVIRDEIVKYFND